MLRTTIAAGIAAAVMAVSLPVDASAASFSAYFYGPYTMTKGHHNGRWMTQECRIKYKWVGHGKFRHRVKIGTDCHWVMPIMPTHPYKPPHPYKPMHPYTPMHP